MSSLMIKELGQEVKRTWRQSIPSVATESKRQDLFFEPLAVDASSQGP